MRVKFGDRSGGSAYPSGSFTIPTFAELNVNQSYNVRSFGSRSHPIPILVNDRSGHRQQTRFGSRTHPSEPLYNSRTGYRYTPGVPYKGFGSTSPSNGQDCPVGGSWENWCDCMWPVALNPDLNHRCRSQPFPGGFTAPWTDVGVAARGLPDRGSWISNLVGAGLNIAAGASGGIVQKPPAAPPSGQIAVQVQAPAKVGGPVDQSGTFFGVPTSAITIGILALGGYMLLKDK